jgi:ankyrin repeat protein
LVLQWARANGCPRDEKALCVAAEHGQEVVVQALFNLGADFNKATDDGWTPLCIAAKNGHEAIVQILRDAGAA